MNMMSRDSRPMNRNDTRSLVRRVGNRGSASRQDGTGIAIDDHPAATPALLIAAQAIWDRGRSGGKPFDELSPHQRADLIADATACLESTAGRNAGWDRELDIILGTNDCVLDSGLGHAILKPRETHQVKERGDDTMCGANLLSDAPKRKINRRSKSHPVLSRRHL